jgi:hypothetical protein
MKIHYAVVLLAIALTHCTEQKRPLAVSSGETLTPAPTVPQTEPVTPAPTTPTPAKNDSLNDFKPVAEMLARSCSPCHIPGGKMYDRLPFDNPEIVASHGTSMLGRIKSTEDHALLETWLAGRIHDVH